MYSCSDIDNKLSQYNWDNSPVKQVASSYPEMDFAAAKSLKFELLLLKWPLCGEVNSYC